MKKAIQGYAPITGITTQINEIIKKVTLVVAFLFSIWYYVIYHVREVILMFKKISYNDAVNNRIFSDRVSKRIAIMLPAHNEGNSIDKTLKSLKELIIPDGFILDVFIALDNCTDNTEKVVEDNSKGLNIHVLETVDNHERKVGALNQLYQLFLGDMSEGADRLSDEHLETTNNIMAFLGIDADVYLEKHCLEILYKELMSKYNIGGVSANYTSLMPESKKRILAYDVNAEDKLSKGQHGGVVARFITAQQNKSFASWTLEQKTNGFSASILGGQCTLFRPQALQDIYNHYKLNGVYDNATDTEDLLLTQQLRELGWKPVISVSARCYVDSMKDMKSYVSQQTKWTVGKLDYTTKAGVSTNYARKNWMEELTLFMNGIIRVMLLILIPASIALNEFKWSWIWAIPLVFSAILNTIISFKVPRHRFVDVLLGITTISAEFSIWFDLYIHLKSWKELSKSERSDTWAMQYAAENGLSKSGTSGLLSLFAVILLIALGIYFHIITLDSAIMTIKPYIASGFQLLTYMTLFTSFLMVIKLFKIRGNFKA